MVMKNVTTNNPANALRFRNCAIAATSEPPPTAWSRPIRKDSFEKRRRESLGMALAAKSSHAGTWHVASRVANALSLSLKLC